jgi:hypothetical protein
MASPCACQGADAALAWDAIHSRTLRTLVVDVHESLDVTQCDRCGQRFAVHFHERVDYSGAGDDQTWRVVPITEAEAGQDDLMRAFDGRRMLVRSTGHGIWWKA